MRAANGIASILALCTCFNGVARAQSFCTELLTNGNAELGDVTGWTSTGIEARESAAVGTTGLPPGVSICDFTFSGFTGPEVQTATQQVDLMALAAQIDSGAVTSQFRTLIQSRSDGTFIDQGFATLRFLNSGGGEIESQMFTNSPDAALALAWESFMDMRVIPTGCRRIEVELRDVRTIGLSTDAFFDNVSVKIWTDACTAADLNGDGIVNGLDLAMLLAAWTGAATYEPCPAALAADLNGDLHVNGFDLALLLGAWG